MKLIWCGVNFFLNRFWQSLARWVLALLVLATPAVAKAQFTFATNNGTLTLTAYNGPGGVVAVPGFSNGLPVTDIGNSVFYGNSNVTSVILPNSVNIIEMFAFCRCTSLTNIIIPAGVTNLGYCSFELCNSLAGVYFQGNAPSADSSVFSNDFTPPTAYHLGSATGWGSTYYGIQTAYWNLPQQLLCATNNGAISITAFIGAVGSVGIPSSINGLPVTSLGPGAFEYSSAVTGATLPAGITNIGEGAFWYCGALNGVVITATGTNSLVNVGNGAFENCVSLNGFNSPNALLAVGDNAFSNCLSLASLTVAGVLGVGTNAFENCASLSSIPLTNGLPGIGSYAFSGSGLTSVSIPASVTNIGPYAFARCTNLASFYVDPLNADYSSPGGVLFDESQFTLIQFPCAQTGAYTIPDTVTNLADQAFYACAKVNSVSIPDGISNIGDLMFFGCSSMTSIIIPEGVTNIGNNAFALCNSLKSVNLPDGLVSIGNGAFSPCASLITATIPGSVTALGGFVYNQCTALASVTVLSGVTRIETYDFYNCTNLASVSLPTTLTSIGDEAFAGSGLTNLSIPANVTNLGVLTFTSCNRLRNVALPGNIGSIDMGDFWGCSKLLAIDVPEGVSTIASYAFYECTSLTNVTIPASVTNLAGAFSTCTSLANISVDPLNAVYSSLTGVLYDKSQTTLLLCPAELASSYSIPTTVTVIGSGAMANCPLLTNITIPGSITNIGSSAFQNDGNLQGAFFLGNAPTADSTVFAYSPTIVYYQPGTTGWGATFGGRPALALDTVDQLGYTVSNNTVTIGKYLGPGGAVSLPGSINGLTVVAIGTNCFYSCSNLTSVTIPNTVTNIQSGAFENCAGLTSLRLPASVTAIGINAFNSCVRLTNINFSGAVSTIGIDAFYDCTGLTRITFARGVSSIGAYAFENCFRLTQCFAAGNAPALSPGAFSGANPTFYYLPGTTGWGTLGYPNVLWNPQPVTSGPGFGVHTNQFGFNISGTARIPIVVDACSDPVHPAWTPLQSLTITNGLVYFSDPGWTNFPVRLYRIRSP